jgi:hypothetical protein
MSLPRFLSLLIILAVFLLSLGSLAGCSCGDDDDDSGDDDDDNDSDDDDDNNDADDDDDDSYTPPPVMNLIPPVDYDGDGDIEILLQGVSSDVGTYTDKFYLVEPGTFEKTEILSFTRTIAKGSPAAWVGVADFDLNNIWDIVIDIGATSKADDPGIHVYMNGNFDEPAVVLSTPSGGYCSQSFMDVDLDGAPELAVNCFYDTPSNYREITFFDPGDEWAEGATIGGLSYGDLRFEGTIKPGDLYESAGNFSAAAKAPELLGVLYYTDTGRRYVQMFIFDALTGAENALSTPIDLGTAYYTNHVTGDFDGDGITEILLGKNFEDNTDKAVQYAQALVFKGDNFDVVYQSTQVNDHNIWTQGRRDINGDGVLDPAWLMRATSDSATVFGSVDGTDAYAESLLSTYLPPSDISPDLVSFEGRAEIDIGYDFGAPTGPDVVFQERDFFAPTTYGQFRILDLDSGTLSPDKANFDLGDTGSAYSRIQDLGGDGVLDMVTLAKKRVTSDKAWDYIESLFITNGENFDGTFSESLGTNLNYDFSIRYDLTGDFKADLILYHYDGDFQVIDVYDCVDGCTESATISSDPDEFFYLRGPFL